MGMKLIVFYLFKIDRTLEYFKFEIFAFQTENALERFNFEKGETRGGGTAPPGPK